MKMMMIAMMMIMMVGMAMVVVVMMITAFQIHACAQNTDIRENPFILYHSFLVRTGRWPRA